MPEVKELVENLGKEFAEYRKALDAKVEAVQKDLPVDTIKGLDARIEEIAQNYASAKKALDETKAEQDKMAESIADMNRKGMLTGEVKDQLKVLNEFAKQASNGVPQFGKYIQNTMQTNVNTDGGYVVLPDVEKSIYNYGRNSNPMRGLVTVKTVAGDAYEAPISNDVCSTSWTGEGAAMSNTDTQSLEKISIPVGTLYAFPRATLEMIQDSYINVAAEIQDSVGIAINEAENSAFTNGTGQNKRPKGILSYTTATTADATRAIDTVQHIETGSAGAFGATPADWQKLNDVIMALKAGYRANATWIMNSLTAAKIMNIASADKTPVWQPSLQAGVPDRLLGYNVVYNEDMPDIASNSLSIAFGDFRSAYVIAEKPGMYLEYDPYSGRPYIQWDFRKRVGGGVRDTAAYKLLKFTN